MKSKDETENKDDEIGLSKNESPDLADAYSPENINNFLKSLDISPDQRYSIRYFFNQKNSSLVSLPVDLKNLPPIVFEQQYFRDYVLDLVSKIITTEGYWVRYKEFSWVDFKNKFNPPEGYFFTDAFLEFRKKNWLNRIEWGDALTQENASANNVQENSAEEILRKQICFGDLNEAFPDLNSVEVKKSALAFLCKRCDSEFWQENTYADYVKQYQEKFNISDDDISQAIIDTITNDKHQFNHEVIFKNFPYLKSYIKSGQAIQQAKNYIEKKYVDGSPVDELMTFFNLNRDDFNFAELDQKKHLNNYNIFLEKYLVMKHDKGFEYDLEKVSEEFTEKQWYNFWLQSADSLNVVSALAKYIVSKKSNLEEAKQTINNIKTPSNLLKKAINKSFVYVIEVGGKLPDIENIINTFNLSGYDSEQVFALAFADRLISSRDAANYLEVETYFDVKINPDDPEQRNHFKQAFFSCLAQGHYQKALYIKNRFNFTAEDWKDDELLKQYGGALFELFKDRQKLKLLSPEIINDLLADYPDIYRRALISNRQIQANAEDILTEVVMEGTLNRDCSEKEYFDKLIELFSLPRYKVLNKIRQKINNNCYLFSFGRQRAKSITDNNGKYYPDQIDYQEENKKYLDAHAEDIIEEALERCDWLSLEDIKNKSGHEFATAHIQQIIEEQKQILTDNNKDLRSRLYAIKLLEHLEPENFKEKYLGEQLTVYSQTDFNFFQRFYEVNRYSINNQPLEIRKNNYDNLLSVVMENDGRQEIIKEIVATSVHYLTEDQLKKIFSDKNFSDYNLSIYCLSHFKLKELRPESCPDYLINAIYAKSINESQTNFDLVAPTKFKDNIFKLVNKGGDITKAYFQKSVLKFFAENELDEQQAEKIIDQICVYGIYDQFESALPLLCKCVREKNDVGYNRMNEIAEMFYINQNYLFTSDYSDRLLNYLYNLPTDKIDKLKQFSELAKSYSYDNLVLQKNIFKDLEQVVNLTDFEFDQIKKLIPANISANNFSFISSDNEHLLDYLLNLSEDKISRFKQLSIIAGQNKIFRWRKIFKDLDEFVNLPEKNYQNFINHSSLSFNQPTSFSKGQWFSGISAYVSATEDENWLNLSTDYKNQIIEIFSGSYRDQALTGMQEEWSSFLANQENGSLPLELNLLSEYIKNSGGAGNLKHVESLGKLIYQFKEMSFNNRTTDRTKQEVKNFLNKQEQQMTKDRWAQDDKSDFYSLSSDLLQAAPSLYSAFEPVINNLSPKELKVMIKELLPLYQANLVIIQKLDNSGNPIYQATDLVGIRSGLKNLSVNLSNLETDKLGILMQEKERLLEVIKNSFEKRFGIKKTPDSFTKENIRSIQNCVRYLGNIAKRSRENEAIISMFLSLKLNNQWLDLRQNKEINLDELLDQERVGQLKPIIDEKLTHNNLPLEVVNLSPDQAERFQEILQQDELNNIVGNLQTIDVKLGNIKRNIEELIDPDIYEKQQDKEIIKLLSTEGKKVGSLLAKIFGIANGRMINLNNEELSLQEKLAQIFAITNWTTTNVKMIQDKLQPFSLVTNMVAKMSEENVEENINNLQQRLVPDRLIVDIFNKLGENFTQTSGALALNKDIVYLENLLVKDADKLSSEEKDKVEGYLNSIREAMKLLEVTYEKVKDYFNKIQKSSHFEGQPLLKNRLAQIEKIVFSESSNAMIISRLTNDLNIIIENMRQCLGCMRREINNDTNLAFADYNKFFIIGQTDNEKGSIADEIVFFLPTEYTDGKKEMSFVMDNVYGSKSSDILINNILVLIKKYQRLKNEFPQARISISVSSAAMSSAGINGEILQKKLTDLLPNLKADSEKICVTVPKSSFSDNYVECIKASPRETGLFNIDALVLRM